MWSSFFLPLLAVLFPPISFSRPLILSSSQFLCLCRSLPLLSAPRSSFASMICRFVGCGGTRGSRASSREGVILYRNRNRHRNRHRVHELDTRSVLCHQASRSVLCKLAEASKRPSNQVNGKRSNMLCLGRLGRDRVVVESYGNNDDNG